MEKAVDAITPPLSELWLELDEAIEWLACLKHFPLLYGRAEAIVVNHFQDLDSFLVSPELSKSLFSLEEGTLSVLLASDKVRFEKQTNKQKEKEKKRKIILYCLLTTHFFFYIFSFFLLHRCMFLPRELSGT